MSFLYDQFNALYKELGKCVGDGGEFSGNFEQFRRRHQAISRSVQEADRFLMISNVAAFCCQIVMCNQERSNYPRLFTRTNAVYIQAPAQDAPVPALDSAGCSCGCRVPSSGAVMTVQRVRRRLRMSRLKSQLNSLLSFCAAQSPPHDQQLHVLLLPTRRNHPSPVYVDFLSALHRVVERRGRFPVHRSADDQPVRLVLGRWNGGNRQPHGKSRVRWHHHQ